MTVTTTVQIPDSGAALGGPVQFAVTYQLYHLSQLLISLYFLWMLVQLRNITQTSGSVTLLC